VSFCRAFVVLIAPHIFQQFWEFQLSLLICGVLLIIVFLEKESWFYKHLTLRMLHYAIIIGFMFQGYTHGMALIHRNPDTRIALRARNFFGVKHCGRRPVSLEREAAIGQLQKIRRSGPGRL